MSLREILSRAAVARTLSLNTGVDSVLTLALLSIGVVNDGALVAVIRLMKNYENLQYITLQLVIKVFY